MASVEKKETVLTVSTVDKTQTESTVSSDPMDKKETRGYQIHVCLWALVSVVYVVGLYAVAFGITMAWYLRQGKKMKMTAAEARSIVNSVASCVAVQVIIAAIALLFPTERDIACYRAYIKATEPTGDAMI